MTEPLFTITIIAMLAAFIVPLISNLRQSIVLGIKVSELRHYNDAVMIVEILNSAEHTEVLPRKSSEHDDTWRHITSSEEFDNWKLSRIKPALVYIKTDPKISDWIVKIPDEKLWRESSEK